MPLTITPNMSLSVPTVGLEIGPDWANDINSDLTILDGHNHAAGNGVQIGAAGLNIDGDVAINGHNLTLLRSVRFSSQGSPLSLGSDLDCVYVSGVDLYYNDGNGNQIRMTASGGVAGTPGSIGSLTPPASVTYVSATPAFVFQSDVSTSADLDAGSLTIRENVASAKGITISSPVSLPNDYTLTLPTALPASTKIMRLSNTGVISASLDVDNTSVVITANNLAVGTITNSNIVDNTINGSKITAGTLPTTALPDDPNFGGTHFSSAGSTRAIYGNGNTYNLNNNTANSLAVGYNGSGQGYRIVSGIGAAAGGVIAGQGFSSTRVGLGVYQVSLSINSSTALVCTANGTGTNIVSVNDGGAGLVTINVFDAAGAAVDGVFHFIMIVGVA